MDTGKSSESKESSTALKILFDAITNNDEDIFKYSLQSMPIQLLPVETSDLFLTNILGSIAAEDRSQLIQYVFDAWKVIYPSDQGVSLYVHLFTTTIDVNILRYLSRHMKEYSYMIVVDEIISLNETPQTMQALDKVTKVYGDQESIRYRTLMESALSRGNFLVQEYFSTILEDYQDFAEIPSWMRDFTKSDPLNIQPNTLPTESQIKTPKYVKPKFQQLSANEAVSLIMENMGKMSFEFNDDIERVRSILLSEYSIATSLERQALIDPFIENIDKDSL